MELDPNNKIEERVVLYPKDKNTKCLIVYSLKEDFVNNIFVVKVDDNGKKELIAQADYESTIDDHMAMTQITYLNIDFKDEDRFFIKDVLATMKKEIPQLQGLRENPESSYYMNSNNNINTPNNFYNKQRTGPTLKDKTRLATPALLMEELISLNMVELKNKEVSGSQVRYKFRIGPEQFNITMTSADTFLSSNNGFSEEDNYAFNDWRHASSGGYNGINLMKHLMDFGILKNQTFNDDSDKYVKAGRFIIDNIIGRIEKRYGFTSGQVDDLTNMEFPESNGSIYRITHFDRLPLDCSSRVGKYKPVNEANAEWRSWLIDSRKLLPESVNILFDKGLFYIGQSTISKKLDKFEPTSDRAKMIQIKSELNTEQKQSYFNKPQLNFIGLDKDGIPSFAESLNNVPNKDNNNKMEIKKLHLHKSAPFGSAFKFIQNEPELTIISEAVIDGISAWDLFKIAGYDSEHFNIVSTGGTSHMHSFMEDNFCLKIEFDKVSKEMEKLLFVEKTEFIKELDEDRLNYLRERFNLWRFQYVTDSSENIEDIKEKLAALEPIIGSSFILREQKDKNSTYWEKDVAFQKKDLLFDYTNLDKFLKLNGIILEKDGNNGYVAKDYYLGKTYVELNDENRKVVLKEMKRQFKTTNIAFAYDNDEPGQKYFPLVDLLRKELNINVYNLTPKKLKISEGLKYQNKVDVNDILKTFRKYLETDLSEAQNLLEDFIQPYDPKYLCLDEDIKRIKDSFAKRPNRKPSP